MTRAPAGAVDQLRGASHLAVEATHLEICGGPRVLGRPFFSATRPFSAAAYAGVRPAARLVGTVAELALAATAIVVGAHSELDADTALQRVST